MKINRTQLKEIVKECLMELVSEGALQPPPQQPYVGGPQAEMMAAVRSAAGGNQVLQEVLADTVLNTVPAQAGFDASLAAMQYAAAASGQPMPAQQTAYYAPQPQQYMMPQPGYYAPPPVRVPLPAQDRPMVGVPQQQAPSMLRWAQLAFNKPIPKLSHRTGTGTGAARLPGIG